MTDVESRMRSYDLQLHNHRIKNLGHWEGDQPIKTRTKLKDPLGRGTLCPVGWGVRRKSAAFLYCRFGSSSVESWHWWTRAAAGRNVVVHTEPGKPCRRLTRESLWAEQTDVGVVEGVAGGESAETITFGGPLAPPLAECWVLNLSKLFEVQVVSWTLKLIPSPLPPTRNSSAVPPGDEYSVPHRVDLSLRSPCCGQIVTQVQNIRAGQAITQVLKTTGHEETTQDRSYQNKTEKQTAQQTHIQYKQNNLR